MRSLSASRILPPVLLPLALAAGACTDTSVPVDSSSPTTAPMPASSKTPLPAEIAGWWFTTGHQIPSGSPEPAGINLMVAFNGAADLNFDTPASADNAVSISTFDGLKFTNVGGGCSTCWISRGFMESLATGGEAAKLKAAGWDGISFDVEVLNGFASVDDVKSIFTAAFAACDAAGLWVIVSTANNGFTGELVNSVPGGNPALLPALASLPGIDIYSPQMYDGGAQPVWTNIGGSPVNINQWQSTYMVPAITHVDGPYSLSYLQGLSVFAGKTLTGQIVW